MKRRVVITGMGVVTPVGNNVNDMWENIKDGVCGVGELTLVNKNDHKIKIAAEVKDLNFEDYVVKKKVKHNDRFANFALIAAIQAYEDADIHKDEVDPDELGVIVGSGIGGLQTYENEFKRAIEKGFDKVSPFFVPMTISNLAAGNIAIELGAKGICSSVVTACASGSNSIGEAFKNIRDGYTTMMIAGGTESCITHLGIGGFTSLTALTHSNDPSRASIPFDAERSGFVMGEGAGIIILEELEHAKKRGARIYGEMVGYGATCDAYHITALPEDANGAIRCMNVALKDASITPKDIGYINAHGTATTLNDKCETLAIKNVFHDCMDDISVSSTKSMTGHLLGASGAVEAIISLKSLQEGFVPPTINYKVKDPECDLDVVPNVGRKKNINYAMSNSFGFGGHNATLIFKKWQ
ncbi:MAG: beta-ketoacyl-ACP synthase II [Oscillospiraceae bacterium]|nr:beta-ketoacyl-ACP synthase II [Oscillospiraceae bacterium]